MATRLTNFPPIPVGPAVLALVSGESERKQSFSFFKQNFPLSTTATDDNSFKWGESPSSVIRTHSGGGWRTLRNGGSFSLSVGSRASRAFLFSCSPPHATRTTHHHNSSETNDQVLVLVLVGRCSNIRRHFLAHQPTQTASQPA